MNSTNKRIIVALDYPTAAEARSIVARLDPTRCALKIGKELFTASGPDLVREFVASGFDVFLDLKYHDIPNTVKKACAAAAKLGVWMLNVHASGSRAMLEAAMEGVATAERPPLVIGVTALTSMDDAALKEVGVMDGTQAQVHRLATLAYDSGLDGVVCSSKETEMLRAELPATFMLVTPGIRHAGADVGDQKRVGTPYGAIMKGSSYLVIGRPITEADNPMAALTAIQAEVDQALVEMEGTA
jgi:orotidine-5'-phosphate decarboxylase